MTNEKVLKAIEADIEISKRLRNERYYCKERFVEDCKCYIKAIKQSKVICIIGKVSKSGMSRKMKFLSCEVAQTQPTKGYYYRSYIAMLEMLGYKVDINGYTRVNGCGMDMVFATNYNIIHKLQDLNLITKKECAKLAQKTPTVA